MPPRLIEGKSESDSWEIGVEMFPYFLALIENPLPFF